MLFGWKSVVDGLRDELRLNRIVGRVEERRLQAATVAGHLADPPVVRPERRDRQRDDAVECARFLECLEGLRLEEERAEVARLRRAAEPSRAPGARSPAAGFSTPRRAGSKVDVGGLERRDLVRRLGEHGQVLVEVADARSVLARDVPERAVVPLLDRIGSRVPSCALGPGIASCRTRRRRRRSEWGHCFPPPTSGEDGLAPFREA